MSTLRSVIRKVIRPIVSSVVVSDGGGAFSPSSLANVREWTLDGTPYYDAGSPLNSLPVLRSRESYGTYRAPRKGRCWLFDGVDDIADMSSNLTLNGDFTLFMKCSQTTAINRMLFGTTNPTANWFYHLNATQFEIRNDAAVATTITHGHTFALNETYAIFIIRSGSTVTIYKNTTAASATGTVSGNIRVGRIGGYSSLNLYFAGKMFDIRIYNVAKDATAIAAIYAGDDDTTGLVAHYPCNEEAGTVGYDISGNANHLTLTNITEATFHAADTGVTKNRNNVHGYAWYRFAATDVPKSVNVSGFSDAFGYVVPVSVGALYKCTIVVSSFTSGVLTPRLGNSGSDNAFFKAGSDGTGSQILINGVGTFVGYVRFTSGEPSNFSGRTENTNTICTISSIQLEAMQEAAPFIPKRLTADLAADGGALAVTGQSPYPVATESPCVTGDGSGVYVNLGSALIPATADFSISVLWYAATGTENYRVFAQGTPEISVLQNSSGTAVKFYDGTTIGSNVAVTLNAWNLITLTRVGNLFTLTTPLASFNTTVAKTVPTANTTLFQTAPASGRLADLRITTGGVTTYFPLQDGPGSSNTNRNVAYYKSDGTYGVISNAIVNGTVANIWANRCSYVEDHSIKYGGRLGAGGEFILGIPDTALCADGNAKTLSAGKHGNPYSRLNLNPFTAAELNGRSLPTALATGGSLASVTPSDSAFMRSDTDGDDRLIVTDAALTGAELDSMETYIGLVRLVDDDGDFIIDDDTDFLVGA